MNNIYNEENAFSFGDSNEKNLNYSNISGLGESNYENEDLFNEEVSSSSFDSRINKDYIGEPFNSTFEMIEDNNEHVDVVESSAIKKTESFSGEEKDEFVPNTLETSDLDESKKTENFVNQESFNSDNQINDFEEQQDEKQIFEVSTPDLQKLTEYTEEKINSTDIKSLFDKVGVNVKEASDIFKKNTEMKEKLDTRFEELKKLKLEIEKTKKTQYDEINSYKEEVLTKLTEKKEEIEKRLNKLKEFQANLEKDKAEFEEYRKNEKEEIERVQKEIQDAYDSRRDELTHIEDVLRKQKDA